MSDHTNANLVAFPVQFDLWTINSLGRAGNFCFCLI